MSDQYPIIFEDVDASKPTSGISAGVICYTRDTKKWYGYNGTSWVYLNAGGGSGGTYSYDNAPASPSAYDDEFESGSLDAKWTIGSSGTTNPATTGTLDYTASLTTPIIDLSTYPSWLMFQSDNSTGNTFWIRQSYSPSTNATFFVKIGCANRNVSANGEGQIIVRLTNSGDANEGIGFGVNHTASGILTVAYAINNGAVTTLNSAAYAETTAQTAKYVVLWKKSDVYHLGVSCGNGAFDYIGSVTKTGVTTFDQQQIEMATGNETPSIVDGVDFYRYYDSVKYDLMN